MSVADEFDKADVEAGVQVLPPASRSISPPTSRSASPPVSDVLKYRAKLVEEYHSGAVSLQDKLKKAGREDVDSLLVTMLEEMIKETDNLLGNGLISTANNDLRDASVISFKRAEILEKAIKAVQAKQQMEQQNGINIDSPSVMVIFRFFMSKAHETFDHMGVGNELNDLFFRTFADLAQEWKKELKKQFEDMKAVR